MTMVTKMTIMFKMMSMVMIGESDDDNGNKDDDHV